jgi:transcriptional regulator with XRE-family HTH domain
MILHQDELHAHFMEDPEYAAYWAEMEPSFKAGELLVGLRIEYQLTQAQLAEKAGVKREYIAWIESGDANPTVRSLGRILRGLGLGLDLGYSGPDEAGVTGVECIDTSQVTGQPVIVSAEIIQPPGDVEVQGLAARAELRVPDGEPVHVSMEG